MKSCSRVFNLADEHNAEIIYDSIGVGAGCGSKFDEINQSKYNREKVSYTPFNAGGKVDNPDQEYEDVYLIRICSLISKLSYGGMLLTGLEIRI